MVTSPSRAWLAFAVVGLSLLSILAPFIWIVGVSLKFQIDILTGAFPFEPVAVNFGRVLFGKSSDFIVYAGNSLIVGLSSTALVLLIGAPAAYSLAWRRWSKLFSALFLGWTLVFHMIPPITLVGPWYLLFREIGLYNTLTGLVLTHVVINLPLTIWLMMSAFENIPRELEEAAVVDGCRRSTAFFVILLPLALPGLIAAGLLSFLFSWSEFSIALNLTTKETYTIPVAIASYAGENEILHGQMAAASVLSTIPALILMFFGQRFILGGLTAGAVK
ncbi:carbohydrate ABC transporter permease [Sinorhizobium meliloti]|uniref:ABC transporter permease protein n=1 Tax=Sinorhizobium meliloti (strain SM11) TaxID=707241 RepID=Q1WLK0_SINMM|nr:MULTISPECIES: carbohydrate ABC transporter permease [Sinorhizobium]ABA56000.1 putative ABC transporter permease protein [Sinorhizobium meliloti]ARS66113.1 ABC transporter permease [Sinorhizobium meliloti RU11/001]MBP2471042.1 multiple sugar transport system permease protein [Sinorhizobium meliloti]MDE3768674.1 carbohydrate ABC transporter permease [Sinorhizobium meliloti]MDE3777689.1 carbohydrate ABC transporter permease [Sinorhizobium meliloti]